MSSTVDSTLNSCVTWGNHIISLKVSFQKSKMGLITVEGKMRMTSDIYTRYLTQYLAVSKSLVNLVP